MSPQLVASMCVTGIGLGALDFVLLVSSGKSTIVFHQHRTVKAENPIGVYAGGEAGWRIVEATNFGLPS